MTIEEELLAKAIAELNWLRALASHLAEPNKPSPAEIQDALERGFACLMSIEAALQRATSEEPALTDHAQALHGALTSLRELSGTGASSWRTHGFVLPSESEELRSRGAGRRTRRPARGSTGLA